MKSKPAIPRAKFANTDQQLFADAVKKAVEVGERRSGNVLDSYITVRDLLKIRGGKLTIDGVTIDFDKE